MRKQRLESVQRHSAPLRSDMFEAAHVYSEIGVMVIVFLETYDSKDRHVMLAYVFWHTRSTAVPQEIYERNLLAFYKAIERADCPGVKHAATFRISSVPWSDGEAGYEDWAVIAGAWALEGLNAKAVEGPVEAPHAEIAQLMGNGNGGVYYHLWGDLEPYRADCAQWLSRPRGIKFRAPLEKIAESAGRPVSVWRRFMVLGPGPEFIVFGQAPLALELPEGWQMHGVERTLLRASTGDLT